MGQALSDLTGFRYLDADDLHPKENVDKMSSGQPLTDEDRWPWLDVCASELSKAADGLILGCSALRRVYRDHLRSKSNLPELAFVHLSGDRDLLLSRLNDRKDHYMPPSLLTTQLDTLEPMQPDERGLVVNIDQSVDDIVQNIVDGFGS